MSEEFEYPEFIVKLALEFKAIRITENRLVPTRWKLQAEVLYEDVEDEEALEYELEIKVAIAKIKYWLENSVDGALMFCVDNEWAHNALFNEEGKVNSGNNLMMLPEEPTDDLIAEILHSKMNAFGGGVLEFGIIELTSDDESGLSFMFTGSGEHNLPEMAEWVGEQAYFGKPWWARDDASTVDVIPPEGADLSKAPASAYSLDFIRQGFRKALGEEAVVLRPAFRPEVIKGDKE